MAKTLLAVRPGEIHGKAPENDGLMRISLLLPAVLFLAMLAGCQQQPSLVDALPPAPNLDGPIVRSVEALPAAPTPTPPVPSASNRLPVPPPPKAKAPDVPAEWLPAGAANNWRWIVIHHSATPGGSAEQFDQSHRQKGWDELGYHFVIGNGTGSRDGQVEVGSRWSKQKWGAHTKTADNQFNDFGIGICMVGDFDITNPSAAQMQSLTKLVAYLMQTYHIPPDRVIGHCEAKPTDCPGAHVDLADIRQRSMRIMREVYAQAPAPLPAPLEKARAEAMGSPAVRAER
jgi:hypothetical protein